MTTYRRRRNSIFVRVLFFLLVSSIIVYGIFDSYRATGLSQEIEKLVEEKLTISEKATEEHATVCNELDFIKQELAVIRKLLLEGKDKK